MIFLDHSILCFTSGVNCNLKDCVKTIPSIFFKILITSWKSQYYFKITFFFCQNQWNLVYLFAAILWSVLCVAEIYSFNFVI